jgi:hypothetical protein
VASAGDAAARADVEEPDSGACELLVPAAGVVPMRVPAVGHDVSRGEQPQQRVADVVRRPPVRDVEEDDARRLEPAYELFERIRRVEAFRDELARELGVAVVTHDVVTVLHRRPRQVAAHPSKSDDSESHALGSFPLARPTFVVRPPRTR